MAKVFDLVHKVSDGSQEDSHSRIPFADEEPEESPKPKRRFKVEVIFFYLLLFAVFFIMGAIFLVPNFFAGTVNKIAATPSPSPITSPVAGFTIEKDGQSAADAAKDLGANPTTIPTPSPTPPAATTSPSPASTTNTTKAADIQILNGTTRTGAAASLRTKLANQGIVVDSIGNFTRRNVTRTTVYFTPDYRKAAQEVLAVSGGIMVETKSIDGGHDILVIIGQSN